MSGGQAGALQAGVSQAVLSYDGSFAGFLCAAAEVVNAYRAGTGLPVLRQAAEEAGLFDETLPLRADADRARRLWLRLLAIAGEQPLQTCIEAFCSDIAGKEDALALALARLSLEGGPALDDMADPRICLVAQAALRARNQARLITGLLRFSRLADDSWYASIEPDCDVLPLIGRHFAERYADMVFVIHDRRRGTGLIHAPGSPWKILRGFSLNEAETPGARAGTGRGTGTRAESALSRGETGVRECWQLYFESIAIAPRKNLRLQMSHMPKKYWALLPEMEKAAATAADAPAALGFPRAGASAQSAGPRPPGA